MASFSVFILSFLLVCAMSVALEKRWTPGFMMQLPRIGAIAVSPDGKWIAYTLGTALLDGEKSEFLTHIWLVSSDGKTNVQYTFGDQSCTNPSFSPDGDFLAFLSARSADNAPQIWAMHVSGGEAEQITAAKSGVSAYAWSNDGIRIAYTMVDPEPEAIAKARKEKRDVLVVDQDFNYAHLYTVDRARDKKGERNQRRLTSGKFHVTSFDWSPDDQTIVFAHQENPTVDVWSTTEISLVPSTGGVVTRLVNAKGRDTSPRYSKDGKWIAYISDGGDASWVRATDVYILPATGGAPRKLAATQDRSPGFLEWAEDGSKIFFSEADRTSFRVFTLPTDGGTPTLFTTEEGVYTSRSLSRDGSTIAYVHQTPDLPPEVYISPSRVFRPRKLTAIFPSIELPPSGKTEVIRWKSHDGMEIEGLLTYPIGYKVDQRYPLILAIHGGPASSYRQDFTGEPAVSPLQAFVQEGYAILRPNPRGSAGYGIEFRRANLNDWGYGDFEDVMAGVDTVIKMGVADPDSLLMCGWSYGGYLTSFAITRTNRFKSVSIGAGIVNLISFAGTSEITSYLPSYFGGDYWDRLDAYMKHSVLFRVKNIVTPTQILHGQEDVRVPLSQGKELYAALKRLGVPVEMIIYPRMPHSFTEPKFIIDAGNRVLQWFNKHLGRQP